MKNVEDRLVSNVGVGANGASTPKTAVAVELRS